MEHTSRMPFDRRSSDDERAWSLDKSLRERVSGHLWNIALGLAAAIAMISIAWQALQ